MNSDIGEWAERQFAVLERLHKRGSIPALIEAMKVASRCRVSLPVWASKGIVKVLDELCRNDFEGRKGRNANWVKEYHQDMIDLERYETILKLREKGVKWKDVYETASQVLEETEAKGSDATMQKAYKRVKQREQSAPWRYHVFSIYKPPGIAGRPANITRLKLIDDILKMG